MNKIIHSIIGGTLLLSFLFVLGCSKENRCNIPIGDANCMIDLDSPFAYPLWTPGGAIKVHGGHKGLWVFCNAINDYSVYEATCPLDHEVGVELSKDFYGVLECPKCGSKFINGMPADGSATPCPLFQYSVHKDGHFLYISN